MIRVRYLDALETERFELLPAGPYGRSFLREYAEFLGLDGDLFTAEYGLRFAAAEPEPPSPPSGKHAETSRALSCNGMQQTAACGDEPVLRCVLPGHGPAGGCAVPDLGGGRPGASSSSEQPTSGNAGRLWCTSDAPGPPLR